MGKFSLKNLFGSATDKVLKEVGSIIDNVSTTKEEKAEAVLSYLDKELEEDRLIIQDRDSARELQKAALAQDDKFSKRFTYYLATFWSIAGVSYIFTATYFPILNDKIADTTLGFLLGTIVATIINYFFGSSKGSSDKQSMLTAALEKNKK